MDHPPLHIEIPSSRRHYLNVCRNGGERLGGDLKHERICWRSILTQSDNPFIDPDAEWIAVAMRTDGDVYCGKDWMTYLGRVQGSEIKVRQALGNPVDLPECWLEYGWFLKIPWDGDHYAAVGRANGLSLTQARGIWTVVPNAPTPS